MNPYQVLGLSEGASAEEINRAYKQKMAYYASLEGDYSAEESALNAAFDALMYGDAALNSTLSGESNRFGDVRAKIRESRLEDAETILDGVPLSDRDAEWYFLKGSIFRRRGWLEDAAESFSKAAQLEPNNTEYSEAFESVKHKRSGEFRNDWRESTNPDSSGCTGSMCKLCTALACCDCLCSFFR